MELIRAERCWENVEIKGIKTYVEIEVKTNDGEKFIIKIHEDAKSGIKCNIGRNSTNVT